MQFVERSLGISTKDVQELAPSIQAAVTTAKSQYLQNTHPKLRLLDNLILLSLGTFVLQVVYGLLINRDPFYSFIAGVFCSLGVFAMSASMRAQLTMRDEFNGLHERRIVFEFVAGTLLVFFASLLLMG